MGCAGTLQLLGSFATMNIFLWGKPQRFYMSGRAWEIVFGHTPQSVLALELWMATVLPKKY